MFEDKKRIYKNEFNQILNSISDISDDEQKYLNEIFANDLIDGLTEFELRNKINSLQYRQGDSLDQFELSKVKTKILERLGK